MKKWMLLAFVSFTVYSFAGKYEAIHTGHILLGGEYTNEQIQAAIKKALIGRGWRVEESKTGVIHAKIHVRSHTAKVKISYDKNDLKIHYKDSSNLGYRKKKGEELIHRNYNRWVIYLERDIETYLERSS